VKLLSPFRDRSNPQCHMIWSISFQRIFIETSLLVMTREKRDRDSFPLNLVMRLFAQVTPTSTKLLIRTMMKLPKLGLMLVGWGGNNGSTMTAALLANKLKLSWETKEGLKIANWYVSQRFLYLSCA